MKTLMIILAAVILTSCGKITKVVDKECTATYSGEALRYHLTTFDDEVSVAECQIAGGPLKYASYIFPEDAKKYDYRCGLLDPWRITQDKDGVVRARKSTLEQVDLSCVDSGTGE